MQQRNAATESKLNPYDIYGAGAESKIRIEEAAMLNAKKGNDGYRAVPVPEGRMRAQEQSRYTSVDAVKRTVEPSRIIPKQPTKNLSADNKRGGAAASAPVAAAKNPFDDNDDENIDYDESKNPFADEGGEDKSNPANAKNTSNKAKPTANPFGEYDNNLNPFE